MLDITTKILHKAWIIICLFALSLFISFLFNYWFLLATILFLISFVIIIYKRLRCTHCNKMESLVNLTYAINHDFYCTKCGQRFEIIKNN